jgi:hypothetical protein
LDDHFAPDGFDLLAELLFHFNSFFFLFSNEEVDFVAHGENLVADIQKLLGEDGVHAVVDHRGEQVSYFLDCLLALDGETVVLDRPGVFAGLFEGEGRPFCLLG